MKARYSKFAAHYAAALVAVALPKGLGEKVGEDLHRWAHLLKQHSSLARFFRLKIADRKGRIEIIEEIGARQGFASITVNFLKLLVEKDRIELMEEVAPAYQEKIDEAEGIARVTIESAKPLTKSQLRKMQATLESIVGKIVQPTAVVNPDLLGGVRAQVDSTVYDGSLATRLDQIRAHLSLRKR